MDVKGRRMLYVKPGRDVVGFKSSRFILLLELAGWYSSLFVQSLHFSLHGLARTLFGQKLRPGLAHEKAFRVGREECIPESWAGINPCMAQNHKSGDSIDYRIFNEISERSEIPNPFWFFAWFCDVPEKTTNTDGMLYYIYMYRKPHQFVLGNWQDLVNGDHLNWHVIFLFIFEPRNARLYHQVLLIAHKMDIHGPKLLDLVWFL